MKKTVVSIILIMMLVLTVAQAAETPWESTDIKIHLAETFSDRADGAIEWDDAQSGYWTGTAFYEWPEAQWKNGQLVMTDFPGLNGGGDTRFTFRILTQEMPLADITGSIGVGFYVENNTANVQSIGFYMIGSGCCLKNNTGTKILFVSTDGKKTEYTVTDSEMAMIPAGAKGYVLGFYEDFINLWSPDQYRPESDPIKMPGFEITNMLIDGSKGESLVIDDVFFFGNCSENNSEAILNRVVPGQTDETTDLPEGNATNQPEGNATNSPEGDATIAPDPTADQNPNDESQGGDVIYFVLSAVILCGAVIASALILKKKN